MWMWHHIPPVVLDFGFGTLKLDWRRAKADTKKTGGCEFLLQGYQLWNNYLLWFVNAPQGLLGFFRGSPMWCFSCPAQWFDFLNLLRYAIMEESGMIRMVKWMVHGGIDMRVARKRQSTPYNFTMMVCLLQHSWCRQKRYHDHDIVKVPFQPRVLILSFMFSKCFMRCFDPKGIIEPFSHRSTTILNLLK